MSSAEAAVDDAVVMRQRFTPGMRRARRRCSRCSPSTQLTWIGALVYGAIWLLT